jgi:hypothetical protein
MIRTKKLMTMLISTLALSALLLTGEVLTIQNPAHAAITNICNAKTEKRYGYYSYNLPTLGVGGSATNCFNGPASSQQTAATSATINYALKHGHSAYKSFNANIVANSTAYNSYTAAGVKKIQTWNQPSAGPIDGLLGPRTKNVTYWPAYYLPPNGNLYGQYSAVYVMSTIRIFYKP